MLGGEWEGGKGKGTSVEVRGGRKREGDQCGGKGRVIATPAGVTRVMQSCLMVCGGGSERLGLAVSPGCLSLDS